MSDSGGLESLAAVTATTPVYLLRVQYFLAVVDTLVLCTTLIVI